MKILKLRNVISEINFLTELQYKLNVSEARISKFKETIQQEIPKFKQWNKIMENIGKNFRQRFTSPIRNTKRVKQNEHEGIMGGNGG